MNLIYQTGLFQILKHTFSWTNSSELGLDQGAATLRHAMFHKARN
jgi:hypothetical protein